MKQIIECVPNFSEGRDMDLIHQITGQIESVEGVKLLDVDPGKATNRTVVTFVGTPEAVIEAAFLAVKKAGELIDMRKHSGEHPRFGATDVCPLVPVSGITMEETVAYARRLAERYDADPNIWFDSVDKWLLRKAEPQYYTDQVVRHGFARGTETYNFVRDIIDRYEHYKNIVNSDIIASW